MYRTDFQIYGRRTCQDFRRDDGASRDPRRRREWKTEGSSVGEGETFGCLTTTGQVRGRS
jgi:hypothetical protein